MEIYNETIRDLLRESVEDPAEHDVKRDADGNAFVSNATTVSFDPNDSAAAAALLVKASKFRSQGSTNMNEESSRSHSIFTLRLEAVNDKDDLQLKGSLSLVDLAGSERLDRSGATGDSAKEAMAINKSLSALADVFLAIRKKENHVPYRNSKLTSLLQPALGGDGRTLMLISLSPTEASAFEAYSSCKFATQVNKCELGKPRKMINDLSEVKAELAELQQQQQLLLQQQARTPPEKRPSVEKRPSIVASKGILAAKDDSAIRTKERSPSVTSTTSRLSTVSKTPTVSAGGVGKSGLLAKKIKL